MTLDWNEIDKALSPLKNYEDCCQRFQTAFSFAFVGKSFNYSIPQLMTYTESLLLGDARNRYVNYHARLSATLLSLSHVRVKNVIQLTGQTSTRNKLENFTIWTRIPAADIISVLKYLVYWFIPNNKYLSGLIQNDDEALAAIQMLRNYNIRTNLDMLAMGITDERRKKLSQQSGLPTEVITDLVNRADLSRLPWTSKATISNIIGAGYPSLAALCGADSEQLYADFFAYGEKIGKNLKLGNEIENSYRIAKIVPRILES